MKTQFSVPNENVNQFESFLYQLGLLENTTTREGDFHTFYKLEVTEEQEQAIEDVINSYN